MDACACGPGSSSPIASSSRRYPSSSVHSRAPSIRSSATYGAGAAPCTASSTSLRARRKILSASDQSGSARCIGSTASSRAKASESSTNSTASNRRSAIPSSATSAALSMRFCRSGFATITLIAASGPTSFVSSCVPPHAGTSPRNTSGNARWRTVVEIVRAVQCNASSTPPPRHAPLTAATVGNGSARSRPNSSCPARAPSTARSRVMFGNSVMSAPAAKKNGLPVITAAVKSPFSSCVSARSSDASAASPKKVGLVQSSPLSIVTSATSPARATLNSVTGGKVFPNEGGAHAHADAERRQPVTNVRPLLEAVRELRQQAHAGRGERVPTGDRAPVRVEPLVVGIYAHPVAPRQHLHGERFVQLEQADLVERETGLLEHPLRSRNRPDPHQLRLDAGKRERDEAHLRLEPELGGRVLGGEECGGCAVGETRGVAGRDAAAGTKRRAQVREALERRVRAQELVPVGRSPALVREDAHRHDRLAHDAVLPRRGRALLRADGERVGVTLRDVREVVVQVLGGRAHRDRGRVDEPLGDEARIEVDLLGHRMMAHVLDAAGEHDLAGAESDLTGSGGHRRQRAGAHAVDGEAGHGVRDAGEERDVTPERQALVADLGGGGEDDVADPLDGDPGVAADELAHDLDRYVVGARLPEDPVGACTAERGSDAVDEDNLAAVHEVDTTPGSALRARCGDPPAASSRRRTVRPGTGAAPSRPSRAYRPCTRRAGGDTGRARRRARRRRRPARRRSASRAATAAGR